MVSNGRRHPLAENWMALFLCIVRGYAIDEALILMQTGHHCNATETNAVRVARKRSRATVDGAAAYGGRYPTLAELANEYAGKV